jgi:DedD protein
MAEKDEAPKFNPRHRILGAIIVVALAVIFVPMILEESEPPADLKGVTGIPAHSGTQVIVTPVSELGAKDTASTKEPAVAAVAPPPPAAEPPPVPAEKPAAVEKPVLQEPPRETVKEKPVEAKKSAPKAEKIAKGWVVQVGVYSHPDNAARIRDKLKALDLEVSEDRVTLKDGKAVRLRVGPYRDRAAAEKTQARLQKDAGVKAVVLAYP